MRIGEFIVYRIWALIMQLLGAVALIFALVEYLPYDPTLLFLFTFRGNDEERTIALKKLRHDLGLDVPVFQRYINFFVALFTEGSLGTSWSTGAEISDMFIRAMTYSFITFGVAFLIYTPLALVLGIIAASHKDSIFDYMMRVLTTLVYSVPPIILGLWVIIYSIESKWELAPLSFDARVDPFSDLKYFFLPILITVLIYTGFQFRLIRIHILDVLRSNYIRTARAKGLPERKVIMKHALRNTLPHFFTTIAVTFPIAFSGVVGLEIVFGIPGAGVLMVNSALAFDWPVLIAGTAVFTTINAIVLAINDVIIYVISPKQRNSVFANKVR